MLSSNSYICFTVVTGAKFLATGYHESTNAAIKCLFIPPAPGGRRSCQPFRAFRVPSPTMGSGQPATQLVSADVFNL